MNNKEAIHNAAAPERVVPVVLQEGGRPAFVKKIGKTTYRVTIHFSATSRETMSDKIKRMLRNEISRM
jgi:Fe-S cluster biogenesis protein NfuA